MHTHDFVVDYCTDRHYIEELRELLPEFYGVDSLTRLIEPVHAVYRLALMIATEQEEVLWIFDFVRKQQAHSCNTMMSSVDVIAKEKVVGLRREHTAIKMIQQIFELAVYVAEDVDRRYQFQ